MSHIYFTDRDLGKRFPEILADAGLQVERHHDLFPADGSDEQWLEYCGRNGRIAISHNERIRYTPNELAAVSEYGVTLLIVMGKARFPELAHNFVLTLKAIEALIEAHQPPLIAKVYRPTPGDLQRNPQATGSVKLWFPESARQ